jgi:hypothetical protein
MSRKPSVLDDAEMIDPESTTPADIGLGAPVGGAPFQDSVNPATADAPLSAEALAEPQKKTLSRADFLAKYPPSPGSWMPHALMTPQERAEARRREQAPNVGKLTG